MAFDIWVATVLAGETRTEVSSLPLYEQYMLVYRNIALRGGEEDVLIKGGMVRPSQQKVAR